MSAMMLATTALIIAASSNSAQSAQSSSCPLGDFGSTCLAITMLMVLFGSIAGILGATRYWNSKWSDRWMFIALTLIILSIFPMLIGLIHDCP